jgi:TonB family protein
MNPQKNKVMDRATKLRGLIATSIFHGTVIFLLLVFKLYSSAKMPDAEGLTVNFGTDLAGMGEIEPAPQANDQQENAPSPSPAPARTVAAPVKSKAVRAKSKETAPDLITQESEASAALRKADNERDIEKKRLEKEEKDLKRQAELENQRIEAEQKRQADLENQRIEAERRKQDQQQSQVNAIKGRMGKSFGGNALNGGNQSEGNTQGGTGNQGDPTGSVDSKNRGPGGGRGAGISYNLDGRSVYGSLTKPEYSVNEYGTVIVTITVNKEGNVISAVPGAKGTTTTNSTLWEAARKAAMQAKFNRVNTTDAPVSQKGTITYRFTLL